MRLTENPLIRPQDVPPTRDDLEVVCVFNPAVTTYQDEVLLLLRVAERPVQEPGYISFPLMDLATNQVTIKRFSRTDPRLDARDPRVITYDGVSYVTIMSHLRLARSRDGVHFTVDKRPFIVAQGPDEEYSVEDARITAIDGWYYINYVSACHYGISTMLARTRDWKTCERLGIIFPALNKDVAIFPEKIDGQYMALTRPDTGGWSPPSMWLASSPDLIHWGQHRFLMSTSPHTWGHSRIGAGTVPLKTPLGWLEIYHGADRMQAYHLGLLLLDADDPGKILHRSQQALLGPEAEYEKSGFFPNVIFTNGMAYWPETDQIILYYGGADMVVCGARFTLTELLGQTGLRVPKRTVHPAKAVKV
jgi:beta-1,2-mannobiose phosphorylase / 1,2-beta-oligomannan phosphorylase